MAPCVASDECCLMRAFIPQIAWVARFVPGRSCFFEEDFLPDRAHARLLVQPRRAGKTVQFALWILRGIDEIAQ